MNNYYAAPSELYLQGEKEKKEIKYIGRVAGCCIIGYILLQNLLFTLMYVSPLGSLYYSDPTFEYAINIFLSIFGMLIPFGIGGYLIGRHTKSNAFNFEKPVSIPLMLAAVPLGFFVCLVGNYITSYFVYFMELAGFTLSAPEYTVPSDTVGRIVYAFSIAVVPALTEEFAIRGAILQPLRKYGDKFAIIASAFVFAILHGNLVQAPFAFIAGLGIGYAVCITGSVWTGVLIHFCNNLYSVIMEFMIEDITSEAVLEEVYTTVMVTLYIISILGSILFVVLKGRRKVMPSFTALTAKQKIGAFVITVPMIIALFFIFKITLEYISLG